MQEKPKLIDYISVARGTAELTRKHLSDSLKLATASESIIILRLHRDACELRDKIGSLREAIQFDTTHNKRKELE